MRSTFIKSTVLGLALASTAYTLAASASVAVAPQYDTTHVYVQPADVDRFAQAFLATFGGKSTPQVVVNVLPVPSSTTSQLLQTPVGTVSLFGFTTPVPYPFGNERNGYLVRDMDEALAAAKASGASILVQDFPDPIGRDAVVLWPGGVNLQLYWHTKAPNYTPFEHVPENRVYVAADRADAFVKAFLAFSHGAVESDEKHAAGEQLGQPGKSFRRLSLSSDFGKMVVMATDGHLPYPYGHENTGYEVDDLPATLSKAQGAGVKVLVPIAEQNGRRAALVEFPGGYVAEIHQSILQKKS